MKTLLLAAAATGTFSIFPEFNDPRTAFEAVVDRGPILEIIVNCGHGSGILSYSKLEGLFCTPAANCYPSIDPAAGELCRR